MSQDISTQVLYFPSFVARQGTEDIPLIGLVRCPSGAVLPQSRMPCALQLTHRLCGAQ